MNQFTKMLDGPWTGPGVEFSYILVMVFTFLV